MNTEFVNYIDNNPLTYKLTSAKLAWVRATIDKEFPKEFIFSRENQIMRKYFHNSKND